MEYKCYKCFAPTLCKASILCEKCHAKEMQKIHERDTPDDPPCTDLVKYEILHTRILRGMNRRIIRKSESMGG